MELEFEKYEGLGNDFIVLDDMDIHHRITEDLAVRLCDRHRGIGADGVLLAGVRDGRAFMRVINADGSRPQMCGNGLRCVALHLLPEINAVEWEIDTDAGPHRVRTLRFGEVDVWMRAPTLVPSAIPLIADHPFVDEPLEVGGVAVRLTAVSMGNPHAVTFDTLTEAQRRELGPLIEGHERFPQGANAGFASPLEDNRFDLHVFERGVGWTQACGTGACAAAVAAVETGRAERGQKLTVRLPGGALEIVVGATGEPVVMSGPARAVFSGTIRIS